MFRSKSQDELTYSIDNKHQKISSSKIGSLKKEVSLIEEKMIVQQMPAHV